MSSQYRTPAPSPTPRRPRRPRRRSGPSAPVILLTVAAVFVALVLLVVFLGPKPEAQGGVPPQSQTPAPSDTVSPAPTQKIQPTPSETIPVPSETAPSASTSQPEPEESDIAIVPPTIPAAPAEGSALSGSYDFTKPAPETAPVDDSWFDDAVFLGDSRTDGLRLYGGIPGADFIQHTGVTVFEIGTKECIRIDGQKYTMLEALALKQYGKVYIMLGVNELGYFNDNSFAKAYADMVDQVRAIQPNAVIYLQNLVSVNPEKCKANNQPYYVTNEQIAVYNGIIENIATEKHAVLVDVNAALVDESGILPREGTTDGVHFTKDYYIKWYDYLKIHTVDPELYWAGQTAADQEGA
ncbi:GDSL-type esterase/lipase family protein [Pseudoflavonifractor sp. CLA-AP-H29]|uniref:GDSL-type esterase/lipase family protein n=1 Tax=Pseudoflavonifractor intestinihominis TaxID=3133171 RepID=A0ABV1E8U8_9FIRM